MSNNDLPFVIELRVAGRTHKEAVNLFEVETKSMARSGYPVNPLGGTRAYFNTDGMSASIFHKVSGPPEAPLSDDEVRRLRALLK